MGVSVFSPVPPPLVRSSSPCYSSEPELFITMRRETNARRPGDWLRHLRRCLSRSSDGDRRQEEARQSPTVR